MFTHGYLSSDNCSMRCPYIYLIVSPSFNSAYVGQSFAGQGALGRLSQHLSDTKSNTFKQRIMAIHKYDELDLQDLYFCFYRLPTSEKSYRRGSDYRESVEANVQEGLIEYVLEKKLNFSFISRVSKNSYCELEFVKGDSRTIINKFANFLDSLKEK